MGWVWACLICMFFMKFYSKHFDCAGIFCRIFLGWVWACLICMFFMKFECSLLDLHVFHETVQQHFDCAGNILPYLTVLGLSLLDLHVFHEIRMLQQIFWLCRKYFAVSFWVGSELAWYACFSWNLQFYSKHFDCAGIFCRIFLVQATNLGVLDPFIESCMCSRTISNCRGLNAKSAQGPPIRVSCCSRSCSGMC